MGALNCSQNMKKKINSLSKERYQSKNDISKLTKVGNIQKNNNGNIQEESKDNKEDNPNTKDRWTQQEDAKLLAWKITKKSWDEARKFFPNRSFYSLKGRWKKVTKYQYQDYLKYKETDQEKYNEMQEMAYNIILNDKASVDINKKNSLNKDNKENLQQNNKDKNQRLDSKSQTIAKDTKSTKKDWSDKLSKENSILKEVTILKENIISSTSNEVPSKIIEERNKVNGLKWIVSFLENSLNAAKSDLQAAEQTLKKDETNYLQKSHIDSVKRQKISENSDIKVEIENKTHKSEHLCMNRRKVSKNKKASNNEFSSIKTLEMVEDPKTEIREISNKAIDESLKVTESFSPNIELFWTDKDETEEAKFNRENKRKIEELLKMKDKYDFKLFKDILK